MTADPESTLKPASYTRQVLRLPEPKPLTADHSHLEFWHPVYVKPHQTLSSIFRNQGFSPADLHTATQALANPAPLRIIHPGEQFDFLTGPDGKLEGLRFDKNETTRVVIRFNDNKPVVSQKKYNLIKREMTAHGVIRHSLFTAAARAGMNEALVIRLADIFKYDIDFIKEVRPGDSFTVIYSKIYRNGAYLREGDIMAAEFINHGRRYTAYRFKPARGKVRWFNEDGRPLQKSLMRTPVKFSRISSRFGMRRDPILGYTRKHKGIDYAAPKGTPIHAAGSGTIVFRGWRHGYGRFVLIRHNTIYSTAYAHMSTFARHEHVGSHVQQGQVIGYVGMTGRATGPHLHYEVRIHGRQVNPLTVTLPKPKPLPTRQLARFKTIVVKPLLTRIRTIDRLYQIASADHKTDPATSSTEKS